MEGRLLAGMTVIHAFITGRKRVEGGFLVAVNVLPSICRVVVWSVGHGDVVVALAEELLALKEAQRLAGSISCGEEPRRADYAPAICPVRLSLLF
jgi:hypothetical protein